jgi:hypothetical protein
MSQKLEVVARLEKTRGPDGQRLVAWRRRLHLAFFGYSEAEIMRLGDLSKITNERMNELIRSTNIVG